MTLSAAAGSQPSAAFFPDPPPPFACVFFFVASEIRTLASALSGRPASAPRLLTKHSREISAPHPTTRLPRHTLHRRLLAFVTPVLLPSSQSRPSHSPPHWRLPGLGHREGSEDGQSRHKLGHNYQLDLSSALAVCPSFPKQHLATHTRPGRRKFPGLRSGIARAPAVEARTKDGLNRTHYPFGARRENPQGAETHRDLSLSSEKEHAPRWTRRSQALAWSTSSCVSCRLPAAVIFTRMRGVTGADVPASPLWKVRNARHQQSYGKRGTWPSFLRPDEQNQYGNDAE